jgi:EAL domain-containing protein (putative c-di-GMP-specific phosphodiesterase class I)/DNA-binding NarL/FixJ family response regulator
VQRISVLIADDEPEVRAALAELIRSEESLDVVGAAADADQAAELARALLPDVALVDVKMPGGGARAAREIGRVSPQTRVIALSAYEDRNTVLQMLGAGADGYLVKGTASEEIIGAIKRAVQGQTSVSTEVMASVVHELTTQLRREEGRTTERRAKTERIQRAIAGEDLAIVFQPIFRMDDRRVVGFEALSRFDGAPPRTPDVWFRDAADLGLGLDLELLAVRMALREMIALPADGYLSLNLSHRTAASPRLLETLGDGPLDRIVVEITEHEAIEDYGELLTALKELRARGARTAIDDAGAGFASLRHALLLDPDIIKVDISLTRRIDADRGRRALTASISSFAEEMAMDIVAEGVETQAEVDTLQELGVRFAQGFFLARPAPAGALGPSGAGMR